MSPKGEAATLWWRDRRAKTPAHPHRTRPRPACAAPWRRRRRSSRATSRSPGSARGRRERPGPLRPRRAALARRGHGAVPDALDRRPLERLGGRGAGGRGPARRGHRRACRAAHAGGSATRGGSGRPTGSSTGCAGTVTPPAGLLRLEPRRRRARRGRCRRPVRRRSSRAPAGRRTRRSGARGRRSPPTLRLAIVHHTAGANGYTAAQAPAIVRAIQLYHVKGNGWNDIGYNFLVDRFGTVFEGRYGGIERTSSERTRRASTPARSASR